MNKKYIKRMFNKFIETNKNTLLAILFIALGILAGLPDKDFTFLVIVLLICIPAFLAKIIKGS